MWLQLQIFNGGYIVQVIQCNVHLCISLFEFFLWFKFTSSRCYTKNKAGYPWIFPGSPSHLYAFVACHNCLLWTIPAYSVCGVPVRRWVPGNALTSFVLGVYFIALYFFLKFWIVGEMIELFGFVADLSSPNLWVFLVPLLDFSEIREIREICKIRRNIRDNHSA